MNAVIEVDDLVKEYGAKRAVDQVSLRVRPGEIYGLLGHNGAGKSTTVEILEGHRTATSGSVRVLGMDPATAGGALRDRIGIVLQTSGIESALTVEEAIGIYGSCYRRRRPTGEVLALAGLTEQRRQRIGTLSGGQKRRVDLALGILNEPEILFLDEPTTGFDPAARRGAWDVIAGLRTAGTTIVLTTHYLDEAEHLADRVGVIASGRLVAEGTPAQIIADSSATRIRFTVPDGVELDGLAELVPDRLPPTGQRVEFASPVPTADVHRLTGWAVERGVELPDLQVIRASLEDAFLSLADAAEGGASAARAVGSAPDEVVR